LSNSGSIERGIRQLSESIDSLVTRGQREQMSLVLYATECIRHFQPQLVDMQAVDTCRRSDQCEVVRKLDDFHSRMKRAEKVAKYVCGCVSDMTWRS
jgi:hypothetical protein